MGRHLLTVNFPLRYVIRVGFLLLLCAFAAGCSKGGGKPVDVQGDWDGVLHAGQVSLHLVLHVTTDANGKLAVALDSLDQNAMGLPRGNAAVKGSIFSFDIPVVSGSYTGTVSSDGKRIDGTWNQGKPLPLIFTRAISEAPAFKPADMAGNWIGAILASGETYRVEVRTKTDASGDLVATLDLLDDDLSGIPCTKVALKGDRFGFEVPSAAAVYSGIVDDSGKSIKGTLDQGNVPLPLRLVRQTGGPTPTVMPTPMPAPARAAVAIDELKPVLDQEFAPVLQRGLLSQASGGGGLVIGVLSHGQRRIFAYGAAKPDSIFEIGSITKTFTGLILAQMTVQKKVTLDEPIRALLPAGFVAKPAGGEITLVDLATQHSGLPRMPDNFRPKNPLNPYADYGVPQLHEFLISHGVAKAGNPPFIYSNLGFALLGFGLSERAGIPYSQLLSQQILGPLHMTDTAITLSAAQRARFIPGHDAHFDPSPAWDFDVFASAGALKSTASDLLTYLDANLHPERYAAGAATGSPAATWPAAVALDHQVRANIKLNGKLKIALAWFFDPKTGSYNHGGGTGAYTSEVLFNPKEDVAVVALYNRENLDLTAPRFAGRAAENVFELMSGKPAIPVDYISADERTLLVPPTFSRNSIAGSYRCALTAFPLPTNIKAPFRAAAHGDIHIVADGKGNLTEGTWVHTIEVPKMTCKLKLVSGNYSVTPNGTGTERSSWKLIIDESPRTCFQFFSPARPPVTTDSELIMTDTSGSTTYSTSINPFAVLTTVSDFSRSITTSAPTRR
jgi:D-alanyl-D-alanine-carboxypeptidase/D-alanyl-D-alanine-endopeptidase